jgi:hypothetical protein
MDINKLKELEQPQPLQQPMGQAKTVEQIRQEIAQQQKALAVNKLQQSIDKQRQSFQTERQNLAPVYQEQRRQVGVEDTMARQALTNMRAQQGLSASGARGQDTIAQNVIQSNRLGDIQTNEGRAFADVERRAQTAEGDFQNAVANATTQADLDEALERYKLAREAQAQEREDRLRADEVARQNQLRADDIARQDRLTAEERAYRERITAQDFERQKSMTAEERAYNDRIREQEFARRDAETLRLEGAKAQETSFNQYAETANRFAIQPGGYQAEIDRLRANDPNDPRIPVLESLRSGKVIEQQDTAKDSYLTNIERFSSMPGGYAAEIQRVRATPTKDDDWAIPYLENARAKKIAEQQEAAEAERIRVAKEEAAKTLKQTTPAKATSTATPKPVPQPDWTKLGPQP